MQTMRGAHFAANFAAYEKMPIPYHGSQFRTKDDHASNLFQMAKRTIEAGEDSV